RPSLSAGRGGCRLCDDSGEEGFAARPPELRSERAWERATVRISRAQMNRALGATQMCHYITAVFPGDANLEAVASTLERHKFGFQRLDNPHVRSQLRADDVQILTTRKRCDCGTPLASESCQDERVTH